MIFESLLIALRALWKERMRSFLTLFGVLIGTTAVVVVVALGTGARERISAEIANIGNNLIFVFSQGGGPSGVQSSEPTLTDADAEAIRRDASAVSGVTVWSTLRTRVHGPAGTAKTGVMGIDRDYFSVRGFAVKSGRAFTPGDERAKAKVVVIGQTVKKKLFGDEPATGHFLRIGRVPYRIVGELAEKGRSPFEDQDDRVLMPISTWRARVSLTRGNRVQLLMAQAVSSAQTEAALSQITSILRQRHNVREGEPDDFLLRSQAVFRKTQDDILNLVTTLLLSVAAVSLFVGGVGVMNILLVSVAERTREVGVRMAIGARRADVLLQFLCESCLLTFAGGVLGVLLAAGIGAILTATLGWSMTLSPAAIFVALGTSVAVGLVFGLVPARRAASLEPMEALRQE